MALSSLSQQTEHSIPVNSITWHPEKHAITVGGKKILLTATEFRLLYPLRHGLPVAYADLVADAYKVDVDAKVRTMMNKHIDRLRAKLRGSGIYVYCVLNYGYLLLPEVFEEEDY